ncbi:MAG: hypothetical protein R6W88_08850 [Desulfobacterales bacterium]
MGKVCILPMPRSFLKIPKLYRPIFPPIFPEGDPTDEDWALAFELFQALDTESKAWYLELSQTLRVMFEKSKKSKVRPKGTAKGLCKRTTKGTTNVAQQTDNIENIKEKHNVGNE